MSYQVDSICYGSQESALSALAAKSTGAVVEHGGNAFVLNVQPTAGGLIYHGYPVDGVGQSFQTSVAVFPQECQLLDGADGAFYGSLVMGVFAVAFGVQALARMLWQTTRGGYDT